MWTFACRLLSSKIPNDVKNSANFLIQCATATTVNAPAFKINVDDLKPLSEMPGYKTYPIVGSMPGLMTNSKFNGRAFQFWMESADTFGPIFKFQLPGQPVYIGVSEPDDLEYVYRATMDNPERPSFDSMGLTRKRDPYFDKKAGIIAENSDEWWRVRSEIQTPMLRPKNMHRYLPQMDQVTQEFTQRIATFQKNFGEMPEDFITEMNRWALENVCLIALNTKLGTLNPNLSEDSSQMRLIRTVKELFNLFERAEFSFQMWKYIPFSPTAVKLREVHSRLVNIVDLYIKESEESWRKNSSDEAPMLQILLQRPKLTKTDVITFIIDMFFAGIETTSSALSFTLYLLAKNKVAQECLHKELDEVLGDGSETITEHHLAKLSYTKRCIKEGQRLFPITMGTGRMAHQDIPIQGYRVPRGSMIFLLTAHPMRKEKYFQKATEFHPERWERDQPFGEIHPFASVPFSYGTRMCAGRRIAEQEMNIFIARVMHRYKLNYRYKDMDMKMRLINLPSEPLKFEFIERKPNIAQTAVS